MVIVHQSRKWRLKWSIQSKFESECHAVSWQHQAKHSLHLLLAVIRFFEIFEKYDGYKHGHIKLKRPKQLQEILDIARYLLSEIQTKSADSEVEEKQGKLEQLKSVLEM